MCTRSWLRWWWRWGSTGWSFSRGRSGMCLMLSSLIMDIKAILIVDKRLSISTCLMTRLTMSAAPGKIVLMSLVNTSLISRSSALVEEMISTTVPTRRWRRCRRTTRWSHGSHCQGKQQGGFIRKGTWRVLNGTIPYARVLKMMIHIHSQLNHSHNGWPMRLSFIKIGLCLDVESLSVDDLIEFKHSGGLENMEDCLSKVRGQVWLHLGWWWLQYVISGLDETNCLFDIFSQKFTNVQGFNLIVKQLKSCSELSWICCSMRKAIKGPPYWMGVHSL